MRTLLIVDDEILLADGLRDMLAGAFAGRLKVLCRYSAAAAVEVASSEPVDILLTDINMPNVTGLELHRAVQGLCPACRVIYLTGYSDFDYARTALSQQAFAYLLKGEGDDVVIRTVERALELIGGEEPSPVDTPDSDSDPVSPDRAGEDLPVLLQEYILAHLNDDLSLSRLSEIFHFHPVYLSRIFKERTGLTIGDYINQSRQRRAEDLLLNSRLSVLEISREMGFATDNYFCRWFRKRTGVSPQRFRLLKR